MSDLTEYFGEPIAVYTTADALADGTLVDAGEDARQLFRWPVLLTAAAWQDCVAWSEADTEHTGAYGQSESGRLWDVLWMTRRAIGAAGAAAGEHLATPVRLYRISRGSSHATEPEAEPVTLKVTGGLNDDGTPLLVVSFPEED